MIAAGLLTTGIEALDNFGLGSKVEDQGLIPNDAYLYFPTGKNTLILKLFNDLFPFYLIFNN